MQRFFVSWGWFDLAPVVRKKPLNSRMAFRNYYYTLLAPHTQNAISKILMSWWRADPFEAKRAMLASHVIDIPGSLGQARVWSSSHTSAN